MIQYKISHIYILGDGDKIRERIESLLLNNRLEALTNLSRSLVEAVDAMKSLAIATMRATVIMAGGDDLFFSVEGKNYQRAYLKQLAEIFEKATGSTFSFGVGTTVESAYLNLRRAKASGNGAIIDEGMPQ